MRIAIDGYPLTQPRTGVGHYTFEIACALALEAPADYFELVSPSPLEYSVAEELSRLNLPNLGVVTLKPSRIRGLWWGVGLPLYLRKAGFDLFHGTNFELPLWRNRHSVVTIHDLSTLLYPGTHRTPLVRRSRRRLPLVAKLAGKIITPTESVKREVCQHLRVDEKKVVAIHSAARRAFQPMPKDETVTVREKLGIEDDFLLFVGTLEPRKNLLSLLKAFKKILEQGDLQPQLVIAGGEGWLMQDIASFLNDSAINARIRLAGYLGDDELRALYSSCRLFVYPSLYEGFGLPPLEALACGATVIAGKVPAMQEVLGEAARFVEPTDAAALANAIRELWMNESERRRLSLIGAKRAAAFSWEHTAHNTMEIYRKVSEARP